MSRITTQAARGAYRGFVISGMREHDLLEVVEIEEASGLSRWGWDAYHAELSQPNTSIMFVARRQPDLTGQPGKEVIGFIASRLVAGEIHVNNVAVREESRGAGIGRALLETVINEGKLAGARNAYLEVRAGNLAAQSLYSRCGFEVVGRRRNYYSDPTEDALVMYLTIGATA